MDLRHLHYIVASARNGSFSAAAHEFNVRQPIVSKRIKEVEEELEVKLFIRSTAGARLTPAGEAFVVLMAPMMPHLAEECWSTLGCEGLVANQKWPDFDPALVVDNEITYPVQVNGKKRGELAIDADAPQADIERALK